MSRFDEMVKKKKSGAFDSASKASATSSASQSSNRFNDVLAKKQAGQFDAPTGNRNIPSIYPTKVAPVTLQTTPAIKPAVVESPYEKGVYAHPLNGSRVTKQQLQDDLDFNAKQRQQMAEQSAMLTGDAYYAAKEQIDKKAQEAARLQSALASITRQERAESAGKQQQEYNSRKESPNAKHFVEAGKNSKDNVVEYSRANWEKLAYDESKGIQSTAFNGNGWVKSKYRSIYRHMTDEEVNTYNYILGKDGAEAADAYLLNIEEAIAKREGEAQAKHLEGMSGVAKGIYGMAAGSSNALEGMRQNRFEDALATGAMQFGSQKLRENMSGLGGVAYDLSYQVGNMLPSMVASAAFGGSGLLAKGAASAYTGFSAKGNAYNQAIKDGYSKEQAQNYSTLIGASEGILQYLLSGIGKLGGVTDDILIAKVKGIDNAFARLALTGLIKAGSEVAEEELQLIIEPTLRSLILNEEFNAPTWNDVAYTALLSALTVGAMEGAPKGLAKLGGKGLDIYNKTVDSIKNKRGTNPLAPAQGNTPQATTDSTATNEPQSAEFEPQNAPQETVQNAPQTTPVEPKTQAQPVTQTTAETNKGITPEAKAQMEVQGEIDYRENSQKFDTTEEYAADLESRKQMAQEEFDYAEGDSVSQRLAELAEVLAEEKAYQKHNNTVGAASAEFFENQKTDFDRLYEQSTSFYPRGENARTDIYFEMPRKDFNGKRINKFANNVVGAQAISQDKVAITEQLAADGLLSTETKSNTETMAEAEAEIAKITKDGAMERLRNAAKRQETSPQIIAMLEAMLVDTKVDQNNNRFAELLLIGSEITKSTGRALQMLKYLRKMSPEYQLHAIEKRTEAYNERLKQERKPTKKQTEAAQKDAKTADEAVKTARKNAAESISKSFRSAKAKWNGKKVVIDSNQAGEPFVFEYAQKVGEAVAKKIQYKPEVKQRTFLEQITAQLGRFAKEKMPKQSGEKALTATELLRDYIQNEEFYNNAWQNAKNEFLTKENIPEEFEGFMDSSVIGEYDNGSQKTIFMKALVHAAAESGETKSVIAKQAAMGSEGMAEVIANKLIADTGATGDMAQKIRDAANSYVSDVLSESNLDGYKFAESSINSAMREIDETFSGIATKDEFAKKAAREKVVDILVNKYALTPDDAASVSRLVTDMYNSTVRNKVRSVLRNKVTEKAKNAPKTANQSFRDFANLGAFGENADLDSSKQIERLVNRAMHEANKKFSQINIQSKESKESVKQQIIDSLMQNCGLDSEEATNAANIVSEAFDRLSREQARKTLESRFKERKPATKKSVEQLMEEYANLGAFDADSPFNEQATRKVFHLDDEGYTITIPQELKDKFLAAKTEKQRSQVIGEIQQSIADQTPSTMVELINAIRYDNMLLTLRGPMKNTIGNAAMRLQAELSNSIAATIQRVSGGKLEQTRSTFVSKALMDVGRADFAENKDVIVGDAKYSDGTGTSSSAFEQGVQKKRNVIQMPGTWGKSETDSKFSKGVRKTVDTILLFEKGRNRAVDSLLNNQYFGDTAFLRSAYARFLGGYLKAQGITAAQFESEAWRKANPDVVEKARNFATEQAREVTFRANRKLAEWVGKVARRPDTPWAVRVIGNGAAPFRKTLANIVINAEEYSPLGFVNATAQALQKARGEDITGNDIVDTLSKAVSGTVLFGLGVIMRNAGWLRGKEDDEEQKAFDDLTGAQEYAIYLPGGGNFTADWVSPTAIPVFMGAKFADVFDGNGFDWDDAAEIFFAFAEPLMELSMMQGLQDALDEVKYSDSNLLNLATNAALNYLAQGLTTPLGGQLERSTQENRQTTYIDKNSGVPANMQRKLGQASAKIPVWDYHQIDYVDAWGRVEKNIENPFLRTAYELASPAYIDKHELDDLEKELQRLYDLGITGVFPERAENTLSFTTGEEGNTREITINLSADQYVKYAKTMGQNKFKYASAAKKSSAYGKMNAEEKGDYIKKMYEVAEFEAGKTIHGKYKENDDEMQGYAKAKEKGISPDQYYIFQQGANDAHGDDRQDQIVAIINGMKLTGKQKEYLITTKYKTRGHEIAKEQGWI